MYGHDCWYCESSVMTQQSQMFASTEWDIMLNTMTSICLIQRVCGMFDKSKLIQIIYCTYCSTNNPSQLWHCSNYCHYIEWFWRYYFLVIWVDFKGKFILILFFVCLVIGRDFGTCGFCPPDKRSTRLSCWWEITRMNESNLIWKYLMLKMSWGGAPAQYVSSQCWMMLVILSVVL